jgi:TonB family protein
MNTVFTPCLKKNFPVLSIMLVLVAVALSAQIRAQASQLSLADILIALRSKKVTLADRNKILTEAINTRGTTFVLTPEIERELFGGGADRTLVDSIRQRTQIAKTSAPAPQTVESKPNPEPPKTEPVVAAAPPAPDFAFYEKRAVEAVAKGDFDGALVDYTKATEMNETAVSPRMGRARVYLEKKAYILAIAEFSRVIELDPKNALAFAGRAETYEKQGDAAAALEDYKKAFDLDPTIEPAKAAVEKHNAEQAKLAEKAAVKPAQDTEPPPAPPVVAKPVVMPEFIDLGYVTESNAIKMVKPVYPASAARSGVGGQVTVELEIDAEGNVTRAKAVDGSPFLRQASEDAAGRSKFKPAMSGDTAVKARARIVYKFVPTR